MPAKTTRAMMSLKDDLAASAPLRLDHYIERCLWDVSEGYYATKTVFGTEGDFITAPEISQIFGEIIGLWCISKWHEMGAPEAFTLLELGAGRGILMRDVLRVARADAGFLRAVMPAIIEKSERLRSIQQAQISTEITFIYELSELPAQPCIIIANEFFDALPIRQFRFEDGGWLEAFVDEDLLKIWRACPTPPSILAPQMAKARSSDIIEICEAGIEFASKIGAHLNTHTGALLAIDYGDYEGYGDTLQAVKSHEYVDPFDHQGMADLTAHVRFGDLARATTLDVQFTTQGQFMEQFGGGIRLEILSEKNPALAQNLATGYHRLTAPEHMGTLFKVLILEKTA